MKALLLVLLLSGCATTFNGVCAQKLLGENETGLIFSRVTCEAHK